MDFIPAFGTVNWDWMALAFWYGILIPLLLIWDGRLHD